MRRSFATSQQAKSTWILTRIQYKIIFNDKLTRWLWNIYPVLYHYIFISDSEMSNKQENAINVYILLLTCKCTYRRQLACSTVWLQLISKAARTCPIQNNSVSYKYIVTLTLLSPVRCVKHSKYRAEHCKAFSVHKCLVGTILPWAVQCPLWGNKQ